MRLNVSSTNGLRIAVGCSYEVEGPEETYVDSRLDKHRQIRVTHIERQQTTGLLVGKWLEQLPHLGATRAKRLLDFFGDNVLDALSDPLRAEEVAAVIDPVRPALARRIAVAVMSATVSRQGEESIELAKGKFLSRLESLGIEDARVAQQLWRLLGTIDTEQKLVKNPYLCASLLPWRTVDAVGQKILSSRNDVPEIRSDRSRLVGAWHNVWRNVLSHGDTALDARSMRRQLQERSVDPCLAVDAVRDCGLLRISGDGDFRAPGAAWIEDDLSRRISIHARSAAFSASFSTDDLRAHVGDAESECGLHLTNEQNEAVVALLRLPVGMLQGGAGVGKTAVTAVLCGAWERMGGNVVLTALSGKAALQLMRGASSRGHPRIAYTAARLLRMLVARTESDKVPEDWPLVDEKTLLIVDEASMIDTPLLLSLVSRLVAGSQLLLVGDIGQLPPVGIGACFHQLVSDGRWVSRLSTVLRQAKESPIPHVAASIRNGEVPALDTYSGQLHGIFFSPVRGKDQLPRWLEIYRHLCGCLGQSDVMALAARTNNVEWLNSEAASLRRRLDGAPPAIRLGPYATVSAGDPVVCRHNRYSDGLVNGMLGVVDRVVSDREVWITWDGDTEPRALVDDGLADIGLAYALTCHKSQGSSASAVVVLLEDSRLVTREWLYTAITRARSLVVLIGDTDALAQAIDRRTNRRTGFSLRV